MGAGVRQQLCVEIGNEVSYTVGGKICSLSGMGGGGEGEAGKAGGA